MNIVRWFNRNFAFWKKPTVFISSTYRDLVRERHTIAEELELRGYEVIKMEDIEDVDAIDVIDWSLEKAEECEIYLLLLSFRYGTRAFALEEEEESGLSITRLEMHSGARFGKAITYFLNKPFYDEELLAEPEDYREEPSPAKDSDRETLEEMVSAIQVDALFITHQFEDQPSLTFTRSLEHTQRIAEELAQSEGIPGSFLDDLLSYDEDISEEELAELNRKREAARRQKDQYLDRYPNVREKEDILANLRQALLNSTIYRDIDSAQAMVKYLLADVETLEQIQRVRKIRRSAFLAAVLVIFVLALVWIF